MKKVLFATTALIATAGIAAADGHTGVALSGSAEMGVVGGDRFNGETQFWTHVDVTFTLSGETDSGISFGASVDLDEAGDAIDTADGQDGVAVFISGDFGTLTMGDTDGAFDWALQETAVGSGAIADDSTAHGGYNGNGGFDGIYDGQILRYDYSIGDFSIAASVELDDTMGSSDAAYAIGARYSYSFGSGSVGVGLAYADSGTFAGDAYGVSADVSLDMGLRVVINYSEGDFDNGGVAETHLGLGAAYSFDDITVAANYGRWEEGGSEQVGYGFDASYDLGGGLSARLGYGYTDSNGVTGATLGDTWSLGVAMSF